MAVNITIADGLLQDELTTGFSIPVTVDDLTGDGVTSFLVDVVYDPAVVDITGATPTGITSGESFTVNTNFGGTGDTIRIVWAGISPLSGSGTLFNLDVDAVGIGNSTIVFETVTFNEGTPVAVTNDGDIDIISRTPSFSYVGELAEFSMTPLAATATTPSFSYDGVDGHPRCPTNFNRFGAGVIPFEFTNRWSTGDPIVRVAEETYGGKVCRYDLGSSNAERAITWDKADGSDDCETITRFRITGSIQDDAFRVWNRLSGTSGAKNGYGFYLNSDQVGFLKYVSNSLSNVANTPFTPVLGTFYWMRVRVVGTSLKGKIWEDGTSEPAWMIDTTDSDLSSGDVGFGIFHTTPVIDVDYFETGTDVPEESIPLPVLPTTHFEEFADYTNDIIPNNFGYSQVLSGDTLSMVSGAGAFGGKFLRAARSSVSGLSGWAYAPVINTYQHELFVRFKQESLSDGLKPAFWLHGDLRGGIWEGYHVEVDDSNNFNLKRKLGATVSTLDTTTFSRSVSTWYNIRVQCLDGNLKARIWEGDETDEPGTWALEASDANFKGGHFGISLDSSGSISSSLDVDVISGGFDSTTAPLPYLTTPSFQYVGVDGTGAVGLLSAQATTPSFTFSVIDTPLVGIATTPSFSYDGVQATSNLISALATTPSFSYVGSETAVGGVDGVYVSVESGVQVYEFSSFDLDILSTDTTGQGITAFQCSLSYDPAIIEAISVNTAGLTSGKSLTVNLGTPGVIHVAFADVSALSGDGVLFSITFRALNITGAFQMTDVEFTSFIWNEGTPTSETLPAPVDVLDNSATTPSFSYVGVDGISEAIATTPEFSYLGVSGHPVLATGGISFGIPPDPIVYVGVDGSKAFSTTTGVGTTPSFTYAGVSGGGSLPPISRSATTPSFTFEIQDGNGITIGVATTPSFAYRGVAALSEGFGTPDTIKVEIYPEYAAELSLRAKTRSVSRNRGGINEGEPVVLTSKVISGKTGQRISVPGDGGFYLLRPDNRTIEGPYVATEISTGEYTYEYTPDEDGVWWLRFENSSRDVISEKRFVVRKRQVTVS